VAAVAFIAVALDQISGSCAGGATDYDPFSTANQAATNSTDHGADDRAFGPAMVHATVASLTRHAGGYERAEYQNDTQEYHQKRTFFINKAHFTDPFLASSIAVFVNAMRVP
jgi:hypothetical protein